MQGFNIPVSSNFIYLFYFIFYLNKNIFEGLFSLWEMIVIVFSPECFTWHDVHYEQYIAII